jgi:formylglycine-generating enzyme required for sulfatase activity
MNRRNLLLGTTGLALGISGCRSSSNGSSQVSAKKVTLDDCPALKAYIGSLCDIPEGSFMMGGEEVPIEKPIHEVHLSAFRLGKTPVTVAMWEEYCKYNNLKMPPEPTVDDENIRRKFNVGWVDKDHPIVDVNWKQCQDFAKWATEVSRVKFALPSEAQWEYACRAGTTAPFNTGDSLESDR